jgi:hypothetical protein
MGSNTMIVSAAYSYCLYPVESVPVAQLPTKASLVEEAYNNCMQLQPWLSSPAHQAPLRPLVASLLPANPEAAAVDSSLHVAYALVLRVGCISS